MILIKGCIYYRQNKHKVATHTHTHRHPDIFSSEHASSITEILQQFPEFINLEKKRKIQI